MSHLLFWPSITFFYPAGNTSAVYLTENLSPESKADVLLLACGDPRHILYTVYVEETNSSTRLRTFDITCCDVDVAILARNALLFTFLADDCAVDKLKNLWNIFYHMFVDQTSLSILVEQCRKLVALAQSTESWRASPYGQFLTTCDARTLSELRRIWTAYLATATSSLQEVERFERSFISGMEDMSRKRKAGSTAARSAGPLASRAAQSVSHQFTNYWSSGITDDGNLDQDRGGRLNVNPTFAFSLDGDEFAVHYATDPLCGFHLAEAFASDRSNPSYEGVQPSILVRTAKDQFLRWCTSISKRLKANNPLSPTFVIRMFAGDVLMFCQALKYCEVTRSPVTPYNVAAWRLSTINLDDYCYGRNAVLPAPLSFNVIDTSNILDHLGLVNLLVVTAPLLRKVPWATLYTEALLRKGDDPSQAILEHVCGDLPTMSLLLGIIPSTFISQFTTRCNVYDSLMIGEGTKQYHERLGWKAIGFGGSVIQRNPDDIPVPPQRLWFPPEDLAKFLFQVYVKMFSDEDVESPLQQSSLFSFHAMFLTPRRSSILHYNRRSFALLVHFIKTRIETDWTRTMRLFEELVMADRRLTTGQQAYKELCCQLHLLGVYTPQWMSVPALECLRLKYEGSANVGLFRNWNLSCIPQVVTLVFVVPRDAMSVLEGDFRDIGTPVVQCDMQDGTRRNWFAVISATFGSLRVSGTGENRTGVVVEGDAATGAGPSVYADSPVPEMQPPWRTMAPLVIAFSVPSSTVTDFGRNLEATVGLTFRPSPRLIAKFTNWLGPDLTMFRTKLTDMERVFVLSQAPVMVTMNRGATEPVGLVMGQQENMKGDLYSEQAATSPDVTQGTSAGVQVQMDDKFSTMQSFTIRVDVTSPEARAALADKKIVPTVNSGSGSTRGLVACLSIGTNTFSLWFPLPVNVARAKLRVARRSSYVEVTAPLASFDVRSVHDFSNRFASLFVDPDDDGTPKLGSIHRLNLDRCPTFKLPKGSSEWYDSHIRLMFSELEEHHAVFDQIGLPEMKSSTSTPNTLFRIKQTLQKLLCPTADTKPDGKSPEKAFVLCDMSRRGVPYLYIVVARMCLDIGSHTVVADAFVALGIPAVRAALETTVRSGYTSTKRGESRKPDDTALYCIETDADETAAWFYLLPRLTERCRTRPHKTSCAYHTPKHQENPDEQTSRMRRRQSSLCLCGVGVGTEILPKTFERVAPYLTRAAFSPLFSVRYLEEMDEPMSNPFIDTEMRWPWEAVARGASLHDQNADVGKVDGTRVGYRCLACGKEGGMTCSRCKRVRYCSKECQRADWKNHKKGCSVLGRTDQL